MTITVASDLLGNDVDVNEDALVLETFTLPANGTLIDNGDGTWTYTPEGGYEGPDSFTYAVTDGAVSDTATVSLIVGNPIDIWYGLEQTFGAPGEAQEWVNILGKVAGDVTSLTYSLNGGPAQPLSVGADGKRLQNDGDFNVDIAYSALDGSAAHDVVTITATFASGHEYSRDVVIDYQSGAVWDANYSIDWATVSDVQDVTQVIDGLWEYDGSGIHPVEPGYDRLIGIGDPTWDNYEVSLQVTTNDISAVDPVQGIEGLFGLGMLWNGHTDNPVSGWQPKTGYLPISAFSFNNNQTEIHASNWSTLLDVSNFSPEQDVTYEVKLRVEQVDVMDRMYSLKIWEAGTPEPAEWTVQGIEEFSEPTTGSFVVFVHYWDVTVGDVTVTEIEGNDILPGTDAGDFLVAVNTTQPNPGVGEIDVLVGGDGADVFVFGDQGVAYYDDGDDNTAGIDDYGLVWDFSPGVDQIQLSGTAADYLLTPNTTGLSSGTDIWLLGQNGAENELIAALNGVSGLDLQSNDFIYTDELLA